MPTDAELLTEAVRIVNKAFVGMMVTVDDDGHPQARWMGAATVDGMRRLYTLTGSRTRKIQQVQRNPAITWVFSSHNYSDVVTLFGRAKVLGSPIIAQTVWDRLMEHTRPYIAAAMDEDEHPEYVTVETVVERAELLSPRLKIYVPHPLDLAKAE